MTAAPTITLTDAHNTMTSLIGTLDEHANANQSLADDYHDNEAKAAATAYRDAAKRARDTNMALLAAATHPESSTLRTIISDLDTMAAEARDDAKESGNLLAGARSEALDEAATLVREHLTDITPHPLDTAIHQASRGVLWSNVISIPMEALCRSAAYDVAAVGLGDTSPSERVAHLEMTAVYSHVALRHLGVDDPWQAMRDEYDRAKEKHGDMTLDNSTVPEALKYYALMEEVGEVARCLTYDAEHAGDLTTEITQVGALALAWLATPPPAAEEQ